MSSSPFACSKKKAGKGKIALQLKLVLSSLYLFEQDFAEGKLSSIFKHTLSKNIQYDSLSDVGEIRVYQRNDFQSGSRVLKKVF